MQITALHGVMIALILRLTMVIQEIIGTEIIEKEIIETEFIGIEIIETEIIETEIIETEISTILTTETGKEMIEEIQVTGTEEDRDLQILDPIVKEVEVGVATEDIVMLQGNTIMVTIGQLEIGSLLMMMAGTILTMIRVMDIIENMKINPATARCRQKSHLPIELIKCWSAIKKILS